MSKLSMQLIELLGEKGIDHPLARNNFVFLEVPSARPTITFELSDWDGGVRLKTMLASNPGTGEASRFLEVFTSAADELGISLNLSAIPFTDRPNKPNEAQLIALSERFGFQFEGVDGKRLPDRLVIRNNNSVIINVKNN